MKTRLADPIVCLMPGADGAGVVHGEPLRVSIPRRTWGGTDGPSGLVKRDLAAAVGSKKAGPRLAEAQAGRSVGIRRDPLVLQVGVGLPPPPPLVRQGFCIFVFWLDFVWRTDKGPEEEAAAAAAEAGATQILSNEI